MKFSTKHTVKGTWHSDESVRTKKVDESSVSELGPLNIWKKEWVDPSREKCSSCACLGGRLASRRV